MTYIGDPPVLDGTVNGTGVIETTVDGQEAKINTEQLTLIEVSLEDLAHDLVIIDRKLEYAKDELKDAKAAVKQLKETREGILTKIKDRDAGVAGLPFSPEPEDEEDEEDGNEGEGDDE